ncbi:MAG: glycosyltransferase family 4 protein [Nitrosomonas ureae]
MSDIGIIFEDDPQFFRPIEDELRKRQEVTVFAPRFIRAPVIGLSANKALLDIQLAQFLRNRAVVVFEWAGALLVKASHMRKSCPIICRLHSIELAITASMVDWSRVDVVIVPSHHIKRQLLAVAKTPPKSVVVIPYGVNLDRFRVVQRQYQHRLGMLCSLLPVKRVYEAILTVAELRQDGYPFVLDVVGGAGKEDALRYFWAMQSMIDKLGLQDAVTLRGYQQNINRWHDNIDIFISNSYWEGQQVALLEAMASGCFCLSHFWGGAEEVLPAENIFMTSRDLRSKLLNYASLHDNDRISLQQSMRAVAEAQFDERRMVQEVVEQIERMAV